jgi:hypothetical protein
VTFWRWFALAALAAILLLSAAIFAALGGFRVWYSDLRQWDAYGRHAENVHLNLSTNRGRCTDPDYPIELDIVNESGRTLEHVQFRLSAKQSGRSTDLLTGSRVYSDDHIIEPGSQLGICLRVPSVLNGIESPPETLEWTIDSKSLGFRP